MLVWVLGALLALAGRGAAGRGAALYSGFYAPLVDPRVLGYRVDARFDPESGQRARDAFQSRYGYRGQNLIEDLGAGRGPPAAAADYKVHGDVRFHYTYPGAARSEINYGSP